MSEAFLISTALSTTASDSYSIHSFASQSRFVTVFNVCTVSLQSFDITPPKSFLLIIIIIIIIDSRFVFEQIAVEILGVLNSSARLILSDLGRRITNISGEARELSFLFQRVSVLVQRFNAILLHDVCAYTPKCGSGCCVA